MAIFAHTPATGYSAYPPYINIRSEGESVVVTVRGSEQFVDGVPHCGTTSSISLSRDEWNALRIAVLGVPDSAVPQVIETIDFINSIPAAA